MLPVCTSLSYHEIEWSPYKNGLPSFILSVVVLFGCKDCYKTDAFGLSSFRHLTNWSLAEQHANWMSQCCCNNAATFIIITINIIYCIVTQPAMGPRFCHVMKLFSCSTEDYQLKVIPFIFLSCNCIIPIGLCCWLNNYNRCLLCDNKF